MTAMDHVVLVSLAAFMLTMLIRPTVAAAQADDGFWGWVSDHFGDQS